MSFLECMPPLIRTSPMLMKTDVILYVGMHVGSNTVQEDKKRRIPRLLEKWPVGNRFVYFDKNPGPGKQKGAMNAAHVGCSSGWFRGYDWVIRINPDVVIYNDNLIWPLMQKAEHWSRFAACWTYCEPHSGCTLRQTHRLLCRTAVPSATRCFGRLANTRQCRHSGDRCVQRHIRSKGRRIPPAALFEHSLPRDGGRRVSQHAILP